MNVFDQTQKNIDAQKTINGLLLAQAICGRSLIQGFDKSAAVVVPLIMDEIANKIEELMNGCED